MESIDLWLTNQVNKFKLQWLDEIKNDSYVGEIFRIGISTFFTSCGQALLQLHYVKLQHFDFLLRKKDQRYIKCLAD